MDKLRVAVLASGRGSNFLAILERIANGEVHAEVKVLIVDKPDAGAIAHAKKYNVPVEFVDFSKFVNREDADKRIKEILDANKIELVVLAGYMRIIRSKELLSAYHNRIINIHPSLLPEFKGSTHAQKDAFESGCKVSGLTIHYVTGDVDGGKIIYQKEVDISDCKTADEVAAKILKEEHNSYSKVIEQIAKQRKG
jgi:phosphoribosylglycinamide formyltransferase-1